MLASIPVFKTLESPKDRALLLLSVVLLPLLIFLGNPAIALLLAAAGSVAFGRPLLPVGAKVGKLALQTAIVLLGLGLNVGNLMVLSADYALLVGAFVLGTLGLGLVIGKLIGAEGKSSQLISSGTAICGGTAIATLSPVIKANAEQTGVALALVFLLNALALFTFPYIGSLLSLTQTQFGVWVSLAIHDTSSVVATAMIYGEEAAKVATTLKLGRTLWLIPVMLVFALLEKSPQAKLRIPGFILVFIAASILGSVVPLPEVIPAVAGWTSKALLVFALFCIGTEINRKTLLALRGRVLLQGVGLWLTIVPITLLLVVVLV